MSDARRVPIADIVVPRGRRAVGDLRELKQRIAEVGLLHAITLSSRRRLIAGAHRLQACRELGWVDIPAVVVTLDRVRAAIVAVDENLIRNELTVLERSEALNERKELYEALHPPRRGRPTKGETVSGFARETARRTHLSPRTIQHEIHIARAIPAELRKKLKGTRLEDAKRELLRIARLPHDEQRDVVHRVLGGAARSIKVAEANLIQQRIEAGVTPYPKGRFGCLNVDPPWTVDDGTAGYPGMTLGEIESVPVSSLAAPDVVVLLWVPPSLIGSAVRVLDAWGVRQVGYVIWEKQAARPGRYVMSACELCLIAVRGKPLVLRPSPNVISARARQHSRKPDAFYRWVEQSFGATRLDLFARETRSGWTTWGVEATKFDGSR